MVANSRCLAVLGNPLPGLLPELAERVAYWKPKDYRPARAADVLVAATRLHLKVPRRVLQVGSECIQMRAYDVV